MNHTLTNSEGVDVPINDVQKELYAYLGSIWQGEIDGYGRVHRNKDSDGEYIPEWHTGNGEYASVYYNDTVSGTFFFIVSENHSTGDEMMFTVDAKCAFMLNLEKVLPGETERADAKVQKQIIQAMRSMADNRFEITGVETGIENIFRGFKTSAIGFTDMQPKHSFAVTMKLSYYLDC